MDAIVSCVGDAIPVLSKPGLQPFYGFTCSDGSVPVTSPVSLGLSDLAWSDVSLLISALLLSACLAAGWNLLYKLFYRG